MDFFSTRKRSASHGSLYSTYKTHSKQGLTYPPFTHHPLRRVKEDAALLSSPGPLESMLKTTTETGDIGIFSIEPVSTSVTFRQCPRPRASFSDLTVGGTPSSRGTDRSNFQDDRRRLPSYRDTTAKILSLYGSDNHQSWSSSLSSPIDDQGPRSYSIATWGSRLLPINKYSGSLQSQSTESLRQRPRSPFPYPTRLKRPGVRPASPAVAENGSIDYSKMVEIDRVSYVGYLFIV